MDDNELRELFSAFDDVSASDSLKSSTLDFIMAAAPTMPAASDASVAEDELPSNQQTQSPSVTATRGKKRVQSKWRAFRVAAVAACLALTLTGGVAYATPTSHVTLVQGDAVIELNVNCFGIAISASANDAGQKLLDETGGLNVPYEDLVNRVSDSMKTSNPDVPVEVTVESGGVKQMLQSAEAPSEKPSNDAPKADDEDKHPAQQPPQVADLPSAEVAPQQPASYSEEWASEPVYTTTEVVYETPIEVPSTTPGVSGGSPSRPESDDEETTTTPDSGKPVVNPPAGYSNPTTTNPGKADKPEIVDPGKDDGSDDKPSSDKPSKPVDYDDGDDPDDTGDGTDEGKDDGEDNGDDPTPTPYDDQGINWTYEDDE